MSIISIVITWPTSVLTGCVMRSLDVREVEETQATEVDRLLRREEVEVRCAITTSTLYRMMRAGDFPEPIRIGSRAVRWLRNEVNDWLDSRPRGDRRGSKEGEPN